MLTTSHTDRQRRARPAGRQSGPAFSIAVLAFVACCGIALSTPYAGDFEELGTSARSIGMGGAVVAATFDPSAIYYNPSMTSRIARTAATFLHSEDFSGLLSHNFLGVSFGTSRQAFGFAVLHNGIPGIKLTALPDSTRPPGPDNRPYVVREVSANQVVGYVNFARALGPHVALGANAKIIYQDIGVGSCFGMGLDAGATVTPVADLDVGVRLRNASTSPLFWDTGTREQILPRACIGVAKTFRFGRDRLTLAAENEADFEGSAFSPNFGVEYAFRNLLHGRLGVYRGNFAFGVGLRYKRFYVDYGYAAGTAPGARELGSPQQISGGIEF